jgi:hypothetical protein
VRARPAAALALAASVLAAGCSSTAGPGQAKHGYGLAGESSPHDTALLATSLSTAAGTWAAAVMGGSAASHNNFWQLFVRPSGSSRWKLVTPPGVADNGGLVLAGIGGRSVITAFRPSQYLTYTPLAVTRNGGSLWAAAGPLDAALADSPDALAASPRTERLLALLTTGTAETSVPGYTRWSTLVTRRTLAKTAAGRRCGLSALTAAAFTASGEPLLAGSCSLPGFAGIFAFRGGAWQAAGPALPTGLERQPITVLRLTQTQTGMAAIVEAGSGPAASLRAAWFTGSAGPWVLSRPFRLGAARLTAASLGPANDAAIIVNGSHAQTITGPAGAWQPLPALPAGTATLTPGPAGGYDALAVHRTKLTVWQLAAGSATWRATQVIKVPVQFGSSG